MQHLYAMFPGGLKQEGRGTLFHKQLSTSPSRRPAPWKTRRNTPLWDQAVFRSVKKPPDPFSGRCNHTGGSGLKPTVAGRDAGVEATGMTSWRVGASLVRRAISCVLKQRLRSPPQKTFSPRDMPDTPERTVSSMTFLPSVSIKASSFSPSPVISTV